MEEVATTFSGKDDIFEDSYEDEWYYNSISRFKQLQMFDLETPAYHLDLSENDQICITGKIRNDQQEIQEFVLPEKFSSSAFESNDLKLKTGGFSSKPVYQMKCLKGLRKLILSEECSIGASIYELGCENSDYIKKVGDFMCDVKKPQLAVCKNMVALGSSTNNIHTADADTSSVHILPQNLTGDSVEDISGLSFLGEHSLAYCESRLGQVRLFDCRSHHSKNYTLSSNTSHCQKNISLVEVWHSFSVQYNGNFLGMISSQGRVVIFDSRGDSHLPLIETKLQIDGSSAIGSSSHLSFSPHDSDVLSISGVSGAVNVFRIEANVMKLIFVYDGHNRHHFRKNVVICNHMWSPDQKNLLFSSAEDGSFHRWKFSENK